MKLSFSSNAAASGIGLIALATIATVLIAGFLIGNEQFREFLRAAAQYSEMHQLATAVLYVLVQAAVVLLLFPGLIFTLLAGYLFGPVFGTVVMVAGTVLGASTAFVLSRVFFNDYFQRLLQRHPQFAVIADSVAYDGWKTVMLTRTIPLFPFKLSNYCFGVVPVSLGQFAFGTMLGVIPLTITNVSVGALAANVDSLLEGGRQFGTGHYVVIAFGIVCGISTFLLVRKRASDRFRELARQQATVEGTLATGAYTESHG
ncbi:MAG TPA: TVP38/TMEM64 family protein [Hyphomicrobiales bacterium]|nr:TVP38/TMEM64 family protein [Hyphomicrobiales bacterium]